MNALEEINWLDLFLLVQPMAAKRVPAQNAFTATALLSQVNAGAKRNQKSGGQHEAQTIFRIRSV